MDSEQEKMDEDNALQDALAACQDKLFALIRMLMVRDSQNAPDVLQRTNEIILTHAEQHDPSKPFLPWFKSVAVSQVQMHFRSKRGRIWNTTRNWWTRWPKRCRRRNFSGARSWMNTLTR